MIFRSILIAGLMSLLTAPAFANPCGFEEKGRMVVVGYAVRATAIPADQKAKLAEFAETAKFPSWDLRLCTGRQARLGGGQSASGEWARCGGEEILAVEGSQKRCDQDR